MVMESWPLIDGRTLPRIWYIPDWLGGARYVTRSSRTP